MISKRTPYGAERRPADSSRRFTIAPLVLAGLLASGCASVNGARTDSWADSPDYAPAGQLYAAATEGAPEPTVVEPTVVGYPEPRDPLMPLNRAIFAFNDVTYRYLLIPVSKGYLRVVPAPVRTGLGNFFYNLREPLFMVNHLLQGSAAPAGRNLLRFGINLTIGLFGLFDPARDLFELEREETDFEDTLARYGAGYGVYLVLPLFGPSDTRAGMSRLVDYYLHPAHYWAEDDETAIRSVDYFQEYAPTAEEYETIRRKAEDPYIFFRNLYMQGLRRDVDY